jgi:hypothetical protein
MPHDSESDTSEINNNNSTPRVALVDGDVTLDCHIATERDPGKSSYWHQPNERVPVVERAGGASLLGELLRRLALHSTNPQWQVIYRENPSASRTPFPRLYTVWYRYGAVGPGAWRISKFLGSDSPAKLTTPEPLTASTSPGLIVIDDKGRYFRNEPDWWRETIEKGDENSWFLVRTGRPLCDGDMWEFLRSRKAKTIAVTTVDDIREREVLVSRRLSWELTAQDLYNEILETQNPALSQFIGCDYIVVCFTSSAVVVIENVHDNSAGPDIEPVPHCWLIYDPTSLEDEEWRDEKKGGTSGHTYCIMAAIAHYLFQNLPERPEAGKLNNAIKNGLLASRSLYNEGFEILDDGGIGFPFDRVVKEVTDDTAGIWGVVEVPSRTSTNNWTLFKIQAEEEFKSLDELAKLIVREGVSDLVKKLPFYKVGKLVIVDRREIENFRSIQRSFKQYAEPASGMTKPLSIAVFGPPGSGKSFGIEQLADQLSKSELGGPAFASLTFNLSQLTTPEDLRGAFHQIRDKSLSGKLPLVFWDEFDSPLHDEPLGWLRFFLSPMQDGRFREAQTEHFIGRAIFVFAGGTRYSVDEFYDSNNQDEEAEKRARNSKVPDFISRLQGYLNVLGLNPSPSPEEDPLYVIRRAIILNSQLRRHQQLVSRTNGLNKEVINIDEGVLNALLYVSKYKYGVRSMEAAISMSLLSGRNRFERSSLPLGTQLNLHVDANEFLQRLKAR